VAGERIKRPTERRKMSNVSNVGEYQQWRAGGQMGKKTLAKNDSIKH
jgi:hypothetical protein